MNKIFESFKDKVLNTINEVKNLPGGLYVEIDGEEIVIADKKTRDLVRFPNDEKFIKELIKGLQDGLKEKPGWDELIESGEGDLLIERESSNLISLTSGGLGYGGRFKIDLTEKKVKAIINYLTDSINESDDLSNLKEISGEEAYQIWLAKQPIDPDWDGPFPILRVQNSLDITLQEYGSSSARPHKPFGHFKTYEINFGKHSDKVGTRFAINIYENESFQFFLKHENPDGWKPDHNHWTPLGFKSTGHTSSEINQLSKIKCPHKQFRTRGCQGVIPKPNSILVENGKAIRKDLENVREEYLKNDP